MDPETSNMPVRRVSLMPVGGNQINIISQPTWINFFKKSHPWKKITRTVHFIFFEGADHTLRITFFRDDDIAFINKEAAEKWLGAEIRVPNIEMVGQPIIDKALFVIRKESCLKDGCDFRSLSGVLEIDFRGPKSVIDGRIVRCPVLETRCPHCKSFVEVSYVPN